MKQAQNSVIDYEASVEKEEQVDGFSELNLSMDYFSPDDIIWGSIKSDNVEEFESASLDKDAFQTYPKSDITLGGYSNSVRDLPFTMQTEDLFKKDRFANDSIIQENYREYGQLALRYLPVNFVSSKKELDVNSDGRVETIITLAGVGSAAGRTLFADIIKDNKVIFRASDDEEKIDKSKKPGLYVWIDPTSTGNGFYVNWHNDQHYQQGLCCPSGHMKTRFVYKDNKFVPIYEQEVIYLKVNDPK
ncbi:MAG: hypothetical protein Q8Q86_03070 [Candidatus Daviesbacteria bacterium]|nr:hypothetical protein [Candidatus Daviesbacteria bacterium]